MYSLALIAWLSLCALQDARSKRVANGLTLGGLALAGLYLLFSGHTLLGAPAQDAAIAFGLALCFGLPGYALGRFGAADVKLLMLLALASDGLHLLLSLIGAGLGLLLWASLAQRLWPRLDTGVQTRVRAMAPNATHTYPFAPFLLAGLLMAMLMNNGS